MSVGRMRMSVSVRPSIKMICARACVCMCVCVDLCAHSPLYDISCNVFAFISRCTVVADANAVCEELNCTVFASAAFFIAHLVLVNLHFLLRSAGDKISFAGSYYVFNLFFIVAPLLWRRVFPLFYKRLPDI